MTSPLRYHELLVLPDRPSQEMTTGGPAPPSVASENEIKVLTFADLVRLTIQHHPELRNVEASIEQAQGQFIQAGLYPNPQAGWQAAELNTPGASAGRQGLMLNQTIITADKLGLAQSAAAENISVQDWQAISRWYAVLRQLRSAYFEMLGIQREVQVNEELVKIAEESLRASERLEKAGVGNRPDVLRAQVEWEQAKNRLQVSRQQAEAKWRQLMAAAGTTDVSMRPLAGRLESASVHYDFEQMRESVLHQHSDLQAAQSAIREAEWLVRRAEVEVIPDVQLQMMPEYSFQDRGMSGQVSLSVNVPVFDRNQGNRLSARAALMKAHAERREVELRLMAALASAFQRYQSSLQQVENYRDRIIPTAEESLRLVLLGYESGAAKFDYNAVVLAQTTLAQARLSHVQAMTELQLAISDLEALLQTEGGRFFRTSEVNSHP